MAPGDDFPDPIGAINTGRQRFFMDFLINLKAITAFGASFFRGQGLIFVNRHESGSVFFYPK